MVLAELAIFFFQLKADGVTGAAVGTGAFTGVLVPFSGPGTARRRSTIGVSSVLFDFVFLAASSNVFFFFLFRFQEFFGFSLLRGCSSPSCPSYFALKSSAKARS